MPKQRKKELIVCKYFRWKLGKRNGVFFADGRSGNRINLGRHSLGSKDKNQAIEAMKALDEQMAVKHGIISKENLQFQNEANPLTIEEGWSLYHAFCSQPRVTGGVKESSRKRYSSVFAKFVPFAKKKGFLYCHQLSGDLLRSYAAWLDGESYAYRTEYFEITTVKQAIKWWISEERLPANFKIKLKKMPKPQGTDTYCFTLDEVTAMIDLCQSQPELLWLQRVIIALASTGLRISELSSLRWSDIDFEHNRLQLTDESMLTHKIPKRVRRITKSSRSRSFPLSSQFKSMLESMDHSSGGTIFKGRDDEDLNAKSVRDFFRRKVLDPLAKRFPSAPSAFGLKDGRLHSFRHYFCSTCANNNVPELAIMKWLGHRNSEMVKHYYHQNDPDEQLRMSSVLFFNPTVGNTPIVINTPEVANTIEKTAS
ncbi:MAG: site-specific integrase [Gemmatales bacterium]